MTFEGVAFPSSAPAGSPLANCPRPRAGLRRADTPRQHPLVHESPGRVGSGWFSCLCRDF